MKTYVHRKTFSQMFIGALFTIASKWKEPKFLSLGEWIEEYSICNTSCSVQIIMGKQKD